MGAEKDILKIVPTIQAAALAGNALKLAKKKKKKVGDFLLGGTETMVGASFIKDEANFIGGM